MNSDMLSKFFSDSTIVLKSAFENDYPNLEQSYEQLKNLPCPALIFWGRQDQVYIITLFVKSKFLFFSYAQLKLLITSPA